MGGCLMHPDDSKVMGRRRSKQLNCAKTSLKQQNMAEWIEAIAYLQSPVVSNIRLYSRHPCITEEVRCSKNIIILSQQIHNIECKRN